MSTVDEIMAFNKEFVAEKGYLKYSTDKYPDKNSPLSAAWTHV